MKLNLRLFYSLLLLFAASFLHAQNSGIKGTVIEEKTGQPLPGAMVTIKGMNKSKVTGADGTFIFSKIEPGTYEVMVSLLKFQEKEITEVVVVQDEVYALTVSLEEKNTQLDEVVIKTSRAKTESVKSLLTLQKNSATVSDGISAETIKRTPDKSTSDVIKRISGASIQDNRFVIVRGLNDRYNAALINGGTLPSSESDRKAFSFDIFPSNMLDNLVITKTASPDLPGEFAGGVIQITTKSVPDKDFQSITVGAGYNSITTFKEQTKYKGGGTDWLGIDDGTRAQPSTVPSTEVMNTLDAQPRADIAKSFQYDWSLQKGKFAPNLNLQYSLGKHYEFGNRVFGMLWSATYNKTNNFNVMKSYDYDTPNVVHSQYSDNQSREQVLGGLLGNFSLKFNENHNISFKNIYSINSTDLTAVRTGQQDVTSPLVIDSNVRWFTSNLIYSSQINGDHYFSKPKIKLNWTGFYSNISRSIPNMRRNVYITLDPNSSDPADNTPRAAIFDSSSGPLSGGSMFWSEIKESIYGGRFDFIKKFDLGEESANEFKMGGFTQHRDRNFYARQLQYNSYNTLDTSFESSLLSLPDATIFVKNNMGEITPGTVNGLGTNGFTLSDYTKVTDAYSATSDLNAGYLMLDNRYKSLRLVWGVRIEDYRQSLTSRLTETESMAWPHNQTDVLPSANLIYSINKKQNLRVSYSKTLNRPEFRELAPFGFYDFVTQLFTQGNPNLKIATIKNFDLRYEIYPGKGQLFTVSYFSKDFTNPIETKLLANNTITFDNAQGASNSGMEFEFRTLLSSIFGESQVLSDMTLYSNIAFIHSTVDLHNFGLVNTDQSRPLQGQSPYVLNAGLQYLNKESGWGATASFNRTGNRIAYTGAEGIEPIWEKARSFLDLQVSKSFYKDKMELKLNAQNILAQDLIFYRNNYSKVNYDQSSFANMVNYISTGDSLNPNAYDPKIDDVIWITKFGRTISFSMTYNF